MSSRMVLRLCRRFSSYSPLRSNIGKQPIRITENTQCTVEEIPFEFSKSFIKGKDTIRLSKQLVVKGPKGILKTAVPEFVNMKCEGNSISVSVENPNDKVQRAMWGTSRAIISNNVIGTTEGHLAIVKFVGTGYRATIENGEDGQKLVALKIGFPYIPKLKVPEGLTVTSPNPTRLLIEGTNKQQVKLFAAVIREHKKPEPYKGKGIYVDNESIKLKEKKVK
ncbi:uncharacterized protein PRCAT00003678001 [Priceomyces carsonii]|uniref:uncharacterized protein n=1 Tax=Priceomyces carsonii TaxID=28549 RepID=UPI002EDB04D6|nr:unnamed protein product [Priceomyces carsonii]